MGEKRSSHAITEEYAKADPIYVAKTAVSICVSSFGAVLILDKALPQKFSHYRPILGDGNCGWRGMSNPATVASHSIHGLSIASQILIGVQWLIPMQLLASATSKPSFDRGTGLS